MAEGNDNPKVPSAESSPDDSEESTMEMLRRYFATKLGFSVHSEDAEQQPNVLEEVSLSGIVKYIKEGKCKNVLTMAGAGISTSAGIPDFRSPGSGLYSNLEKYDLPHPQAIFEIDYFKENPEPFFTLARELYPGKFKPTPCHYFIRMLQDKGLLLRHYTQNIDTLERVAGLNGEKIVEAHGTFHTSHCMDCNKDYSQLWMRERIFVGTLPTCESCNGLVKPDIVFFGENLPHRFFLLMQQDFPKCDLLIVMGTSLAVQPFASLVDRVSSTCPRLLINREKAGATDPMMKMLGISSGMNFDSESNYRDVALLDLCDDGCQKLADMLGWGDELKDLIAKEHARIDSESSKDATSQTATGKKEKQKAEAETSKTSSSKADDSKM